MNLRLTCSRIAVASTTAIACAAAGAATISPAVYSAARTEVRSHFKAEREACDKLAGNAKDICVETASGGEKVALAHLQYQRSGDAKDLTKLAEARYEARYELAKEMCDEQAGNSKDVCLATARADRDKAKANVKMRQSVADARDEAADTKAKADFKVARERCDAMSGDAKDACLASARARFGQ